MQDAAAAMQDLINELITPEEERAWVETSLKTWKTWLSILALGAAMSVVAAIRLHGATWTPNQIAGAVIAIPGFCLWSLARLQLGKSFAVRPQAKELVKRGLYSRIQHPVYVFGAIVVVGMLVFWGRPALFVILLVLIPLQLTRIRKERAVLEAKFGDEYRKYRKSTWF